MTTLEQRIFAFDKLGNYLRNISSKDSEYDSLFQTIELAKQKNGWFIDKNVLYAFEVWGKCLNQDNLTQWVQPYNFKDGSPKMTGLILAGNIPLAGFHDVLSVLISGNKALVKCSSSDSLLIPFLIEKLKEYEPQFKTSIEFTTGRLMNFDAIIATGSNNAKRYFDYYFSKVPKIIRSNRTSVAILDGTESKEGLIALGNDITQYFGLGCRNVTKVFVPKKYDLNLIFGALYEHSSLMNFVKYANNYDYNKAVYLMNLFDFLDNGFFMLRENSSYSAPTASLHYEFYTNYNSLKNQLEKDKNQIQCIVSNRENEGHLNFGEAQKPKLWDYADGKDTLKFLQEI